MNLPKTDNRQQTTDNRVRSYRDLIVYQKAKILALGLIHFYSNKKLGWTDKYLVDQLIRATSSIGANLAEGYGRLYKLDYRRFVSISRGSSYEVEYWIDLIVEVRPQDKSFLLKIIGPSDEISKMLTGLMKSLGRQSV
jgi:four helix bundle protein